MKDLLLGLTGLAIGTVSAMVIGYIFLYFHIKDLDRQYRELNIEPPKRDWLFRFKENQRKK